MADSNTSAGGSQRTRGYQATRRQDRDRREKLKERLNNTDTPSKDDSVKPVTDNVQQPHKVAAGTESSSGFKGSSSNSGDRQQSEHAKHSRDYDTYSKHNSDKSKTPVKDYSTRGQHYQSKDGRGESRQKDGREKDYRDIKDKRSYDDRDTRYKSERYDKNRYYENDRYDKDRYDKGSRYEKDKGRYEKDRYDRDSREKRVTGESPREFKFKTKDKEEKTESNKPSPKKPDDQTKKPDSSKGDSSNLMDIITQSKTQPRIKSRSGKDKVVSATDLEAKWQKEETEKAKKEEEERKKKEEEERKIQEEERKEREAEQKRLQEEEDAKRLLEEEKATIEAYARECEERLALKRQCRQQNFAAMENRPDESNYSKLDSNLKKCTAFVKKLKTLTESQEDALMKDLRTLNLSKYVGEIAAAFTEAKLKMSDIPCALRLCSVLHQRYAEFAASLLENWHKVLPTKKDDKVQNASKLRVDLRFFADLITVGVFTEQEGLSVLSNQLVLLIKKDIQEHNNLSILISFCKHCGDDYAGLVPTKYHQLAEKYNVVIPRSDFLRKERQQACRKLLKEYHTSLYKRLPEANKELQALERTNHNILMTKGELSEERRQNQEAATQSFQKLLTNASTYADLVNEDMPELPKHKVKEDDIMGINVFSPESQHVYDGESALFEDEDTRQFYEHLPDLKAIVPQILYKDSATAAATATDAAAATAKEGTATTDAAGSTTEDDGAVPLAAGAEGGNAEQVQEDAVPVLPDTAINVEDLERELIEEAKRADATKDEEVAPADVTDEEDFDIASSMKLILDEFLTSLPKCVSRELIDKAASDFCMNLNTKANRKKLSRALFGIHRTRYDLLPFYSRLVATLHPCMPDVALELNQLLKTDFKWHVRKKDQINIESKLKVVRFIGELVKFNMFPKADVMHCIKMLLFDFSHHNIEMACALLDTCGRFLYRTTESHHMTKVFLEVMLRKKNALHLDSRYNCMIENAFYYCNPPEYKREEQKPRPPLHQYIRRLLYRDLSKLTTEKILRQLRKLNWDDPELKAYVTKCLVAVWNVRYNVIHCCANLLAGLAPYHEGVAISVIDGVLEDVRLGLELNLPKFNQRRMSCVKYIGEMYNYRMVESSVIFKTLYSFITFGVFMQDDIVSLYDPPEHLLRIRLVCSLLDTCGQYFDRGSSKKKLDCFLVYFQRYYWWKRKHARWCDDLPFPIEIEYSYLDTMEALRPKKQTSQNFEEACQVVEKLEHEFRAKLAAVLPKTDLNAGHEIDDEGLTTITEGDEVDEVADGLSQVQLTGGTDPHGESLTGDGREASYSLSDSEGHTQRSASESQSQSQQEREEDRGEDEAGDDGVDDDDDDDDDDDSDNDDDDDEGGSVTSQRQRDREDDENVITGGPTHITCTEDDDFMAAFDKMLTDTVQARSSESVKAPQLDIPMPMQLRSQKTKYAQPGSELTPPEQKAPITFMLVTRRGNKQHFSNLNVPVSDKLAASYKQRELAEREEKERMKRVVLDIHERQEEEDYQEMLDSLHRCGTVSGAGNPNLHRERRVRYQHPKGAPDADLIFGSKKR